MLPFKWQRKPITNACRHTKKAHTSQNDKTMKTILEPFAIKHGFEINHSNDPFLECIKHYPWGVLRINVEKQRFSSEEWERYTETVRIVAISIEYHLDATIELTDHNKDQLDIILSDIQPYLAKTHPSLRHGVL